jgi:hypothetical protein
MVSENQKHVDKGTTPSVIINFAHRTCGFLPFSSLVNYVIFGPEFPTFMKAHSHSS